jgi:hypothetical protein
MALHEQSIGATDEWYTPQYVFDALGVSFDMDVAHPGLPYAEWVPARKRLLREDDGLSHRWSGFVWMNPPFGSRNGLVPWLNRFFAHGNGIALVPDRTSAPWFQEFSRIADCVLFVSPKIKFIGRDGKPGKSPAQGTALFASGKRGAISALERAEANGLGVVFSRSPLPHTKETRRDGE